MTIPVCIPVIPKNAKKYVNLAIDRNWISSLCLDEDVNYLGKLEKAFSSFIGVKHGSLVTSGSTALDLSVAVLGITSGDEVIIPSSTMIASALAVLHNGATPVFVDVDPHTWCINPDLIENSITENTKAIMPVHLYGFPCDMKKICSIAKKHNLLIIEDAAEAIGTKYDNKMAGSFGDIACFSFYANKTITSGEGGIILTNNDNYGEKIKSLKDQAFGEPRFKHFEIGYNYRMSNLTAAYAFASFEESSRYIMNRISNAKRYNERLAGIDGITKPPIGSNGSIVNSYWMYGILIDEKIFGRSKNQIRALLKERFAVETRDFFYPMHKQPVMIREGYAREKCTMPVSERLWEEGLYLPSSTDLTDDQIDFVVDSLLSLRK